MKTIYQLAKLSRRLPRLITKTTKKLVSGKSHGEKLSDKQLANCRSVIAGAHMANDLLKQEVKARRIGEAPFRDATPHKKRPAKLALAA
jgi:hypothetical protein